MFQHLDDPVPLEAASEDRRRADIERGAAMRRRRRVLVGALPFGAAVVTAAAVGLPALWSGPAEDSTDLPAAPAEQPSRVPTVGAPNGAEPAFSACPDPVGDNAGHPDLVLVAVDRPERPFVHYHWRDGLPPATTVEAAFTATSADGHRSRRLIVVVVGGTVESYHVLDPATGDRQVLDPDASTDTMVDGVVQREVELSDAALGVGFPGPAAAVLGDEWTWTASITVDGTVVDTCDSADDPP